MSRTSIIAIVPVSRRSDGLAAIVDMLRDELSKLDRPWRILLAVDGDLEERLREARAVVANTSNVELIALARNFGEGGALLTDSGRPRSRAG